MQEELDETGRELGEQAGTGGFWIRRVGLLFVVVVVDEELPICGINVGIDVGIAEICEEFMMRSTFLDFYDCL